jgi:hypothetical protein
MPELCERFRHFFEHLAAQAKERFTLGHTQCIVAPNDYIEIKQDSHDGIVPTSAKRMV